MTISNSPSLERSRFSSFSSERFTTSQNSEHSKFAPSAEIFPISENKESSPHVLSKSNKLDKNKDPDYVEYQRLRKIFENTVLAQNVAENPDYKKIDSAHEALKTFVKDHNEYDLPEKPSRCCVVL